MFGVTFRWNRVVRHNVTLINPANYRYGYLLTDICRYFAFGLRDLGHRADLTVNQLDAGVMNVIVGTHLLTPAEVTTIVASQLEYVALQSEWLSPGPAPNSVVSSFQGERFEPTLRPLLERATAVWDAFHSNIAMLRRFDIAAERIKWLSSYGYAAEMREIRHRPWPEKDIDVLFFGSVSERRRVILAELGRSLRVVSVLDAPAAFRNDLIARARLNVNLHASEAFTHLPLTRVSYLLNNAALVVSEPVTTNAELHPMITFAPRDELLERCRALLAQTDAAQLGEARLTEFARQPMSEVLRPIL
jgi:hypothetical protein